MDSTRLAPSVQDHSPKNLPSLPRALADELEALKGLVIQKNERLIGHAERAVYEARKAIDIRIEIGSDLTRMQEIVLGAGGLWTPWVEKNLPIGIRQCQQYMRAYRNQPLIAEARKNNPDAFTGLKSAMAFLAEPKGDEDEADDHAHPGARREPTPPMLPSPTSGAEANADGKPTGVWSKWFAPERVQLAREFWGFRAATTLMLDAVGWDADRISEYLDQPVESISAILDPDPPSRFDSWGNGLALLDFLPDGAEEAPAAYRALVEVCIAYALDGGSRSPFAMAMHWAKLEGHLDAVPLLEASRRRLRQRREAAVLRAAKIGRWEGVGQYYEFLLDLAELDSGFALACAGDEWDGEVPTLDDALVRHEERTAEEIVGR